jgi:hypothetical protein
VTVANLPSGNQKRFQRDPDSEEIRFPLILGI